MRVQPHRGRRIVGPKPIDKQFMFDAPPELPRMVEPSVLRKALPWIFGVVIIGLVAMMLINGVRQNPMYLIFMVMMLVAMFSSMGNQAGGAEEMTTPKVNSERGEYLRYLSGKRAEILAAAAAQREAALWSHPDIDALEAALDSRRLWERGRGDPDFLQVRVGRDEVRLNNALRVKNVDAEIDLEPVTKMALQHLRAVQQSVPHCPKAIDLAKYSLIGSCGERRAFRAAVRAWVAQLVCWHNPNDVGLAVVCPELELHWGWTKWLPHTESQDIDGAGPARYLGTSLGEVEAALDPLLKKRAKVIDEKGVADPSQITNTNKHVVLIIDDVDMPAAAVRRIAAREGVTVITYRGAPDRDYAPHDRELLLRLRSASAAQDADLTMEEWTQYRWTEFCAEPDALGESLAAYLARRMSKWDETSIGRPDAGSAAAHTLLALLGISNAAKLDVEALWGPRRLPVGTGEPLNLEPLLKFPLGVQPNGAPLMMDLKDEADGGNGPHGLMIGMTGSGKSTTLGAMAASVFALHSPDQVQAILTDFKDGAGFEAFAGYPHVAAIITNMIEKKTYVDRFGETLLGLLDLRGRIFADRGREVQGAPFVSIVQYNEARATPAGAHLPPMPYMLVWVDEFSLLLQDHPHMADVFDKVCRRGRSQGVYFQFASQTLDVGVIKDIDKNTQYKIGLKVSHPGISRQVIGTEDAYHIPEGKNSKGTGYFVRAPGAEPVKFRSFELPNRYEPPTTIHRRVITTDPRARVFTAGRVEPDPQTVIEEEIAAETVLDGPARSLVLTMGPQLAKAYGKRAPQLWAPPLDHPIPLDRVLAEAEALPVRAGGPWWPLGEIDKPRELIHGLLNYSTDDGTGNVLLLAMDSDEASMVVQTFVLAAAARYSPQDVGFVAFSYGGPALGTVKALPHLGAIGGKERNQLNTRMFADLDAVAAGRRRLFEEQNIGSMEEYRRRRRAGEAALQDGYPIDLFVVIDGYEKFRLDNTSLMFTKNPYEKNVEQLAGAGTGIHVMVTAASWHGLPGPLQNRISTVYELKLASPTESTARARPDDKMLRPQERIPTGQPGRGITKAGDVIRFAVGRTDGQATMEDLDTQVRDTVASLVTRYVGHRAVPAPQLLPAHVASRDLPQLDSERYALGVRGRDLQPLVVDFADSPLLAVYGDDHHGKTSFLDNMVRNVVSRRKGPDDAMIVLFSPQRELKSVTSLLVPGEDYYETNAEDMAKRVAVLALMCDQRKPPADLNNNWEQLHQWTFEGPKVWLFIDDLQVIPTQVTMEAPGLATGAPMMQQVSVWQPLLRHLGTARDVGLRVVVTHRATQLTAAEMTPNSVPGALSVQNANRLLLGSVNDTDKVRGRKFERLAPGRGYLIATRDTECDYVQLAAPHDAMLPTC